MSASKGHILLIDDEPDLVAAHARSLAAVGYAVKTASDGASAMIFLESEKFDLVISDINMPSPSGIELLRWVRANNPELKVILMTGFTVEHSPQEAIDLGCHGFLAKPVSNAELLRITNDALSGAPDDKISAKDYARIPIDAFLSGRKVDFSIYVRLGGVRFLKIAHGGDDIDLVRVQELNSRGVTELWIEQGDLEKYSRLSQNIAKISSTKTDWSVDKRSQLLLNACDVAAESLRLSGISETSIESARQTLSMAVDFLSETKAGSEILAVFAHATPSAYSKAATCGCLCGMIAKVLGWESARTVMSLTLAGFLHDVGLYSLSQELQEKPVSKLTPQELAEYRQHPLLAVEMLTGLPGLLPETLTAIAEHHEDTSPEAFPKGLSRSAILPMSKIVMMLDGFVEGLVKLRPEEKTNPGKLVSLLETMQPRPLDEASYDALIFLVKSGDVSTARDKFKRRASSRAPRA